MSAQQQYLYRIQPVRPAMLTDGPTEDEARIVEAHFNYLKNLTEQRIVFLAGRTTNIESNSFGIIIFVAENDAAADAIVQGDPAVINRVMRAELFPYRVALLNAKAIS